MTRSALNLLLLAGLALTAALNWVVRPDPARPNLEFLPEMAHSVPFDSLSANPNFPDGKTLQRPVPGTIPRGFRPMYYEANPEGALRAGQELRNPFYTDDDWALRRGEFVFGAFCQSCHGVAGVGDGLVALRGYPPPPSFLTEEALNLKDGQMFHIITYGRENMPSHATQVSREDRWKAILYIRSLQQQSKPAAESSETPPEI